MLCAVTVLGLGLLSFWPIIVVMLPYLLMSFAMATASLIGFILIAWCCFRRKICHSLAVRAFFLLPFHAVFVVAVVSVFSLSWSIALGACIFVQGEVFWRKRTSCLTPHRRWDAVIRQFDAWSWPVFEYFPMTLHRDVGVGDSATTQTQASAAQRHIFCYHPHGISCTGLFSLVWRQTSGFARLYPESSSSLFVGVASALLHVPLFGRLCAYFGSVCEG